MKLRLFVACFVLTAPLFSSIPSASAADLSTCLTIRNIQATVSGGNKVNFNADVYQVCQEFTPAFGGVGVLSYMPTYSLTPLGISCSGPMLKTERINPGLTGYYLGAIICSGTTTSYGTSSSRVQAWLPGESSSVGFSHTSISAARQLSQCTSLENPRSSTSATSITLQIDVYSICSSLIREGERPVYQMMEEDSLLNLSSCSGPSLRATSLNKEFMGTATCTLRIGSTHSFLASSRTGATRTTIGLFFAWDLSRTSAVISHSSIPSSSSSSGTIGGGTVTPICSGAPSVPNLSYTNLTDGIQFTATAQTSGEKATNLSYTYSYLDEAKGIWGEWNEWITVSSLATISYKAPSGNGKIAVAFAVYASNSCGKSAQVRESISKTGLNLPEVPASPDAVQEAIDAANAATDAANAAAVTSSMNLVAAQSSLDIVAALSLQVDEMISSLKVQIAALSALILKIQAKMSR